MMIGHLHHHIRSELSYYTCYFRLIGCSPPQHLSKVGGDLLWSTTANFRFIMTHNSNHKCCWLSRSCFHLDSGMELMSHCPFCSQHNIVFFFEDVCLSIQLIQDFYIYPSSCRVHFSGNTWYFTLSGFKLITMVRILLLKFYQCIIICVSIPKILDWSWGFTKCVEVERS